ncbi:hypothetical protein Tco_0697689 [Tanacetum coccineum]
MIGMKITQETIDKIFQIKGRRKAARDSQKRYADNRRKPLESSIDDQVLLKIGRVTYQLRLPQELISVHDTFNMSNLKKCMVDANLHVPLDEIKIDNNLHFVEEPAEIIDHEIKNYKRSKIPIVKVRWNSKQGP